MRRNRVLYLEIADKIREDIFAGKYPVGSMLPTETELEEIFNVSKITVRKAIELLAADEYVEKKSGKGTTVINNRPYNKLSKAISFTSILEKSNLTIEKKTLEIKKVSLDETDELYPYFGSQAICLSRIYLRDQEPFIYIKHFLPGNLKYGSQTDLEKGSLYQMLHQNNYEIEKFKDEYIAIMLDEEQQKLLQTSEKIAIKRIRRSIDFDGCIVEYSEGIYNTAEQPYQIEYET